MFSCTHLWGWVRFWTIAGELEVRGTKLIYFPRLYTDCKYILSQMRHGVDKYISPEYIHILWPQSVPNNIWLPLTLSLPVYWHTNIFLVGGGRIGTTSGRKLRRGPEMELRRVGRGQWRCPQYNFPIVRQLYFIFAFRISVFCASYFHLTQTFQSWSRITLCFQILKSLSQLYTR